VIKCLLFGDKGEICNLIISGIKWTADNLKEIQMHDNCIFSLPVRLCSSVIYPQRLVLNVWGSLWYFSSMMMSHSYSHIITSGTKSPSVISSAGASHGINDGIIALHLTGEWSGSWLHLESLRMRMKQNEISNQQISNQLAFPAAKWLNANG